MSTFLKITMHHFKKESWTSNFLSMLFTQTISSLKNYHKGHRLWIQLNKANAIYRQFINLFNLRFNLFFTNVANLVDLDLMDLNFNILNKEKKKKRTKYN